MLPYNTKYFRKKFKNSFHEDLIICILTSDDDTPQPRKKQKKSSSEQDTHQTSTGGEGQSKGQSENEGKSVKKGKNEKKRASLNSDSSQEDVSSNSISEGSSKKKNKRKSLDVSEKNGAKMGKSLEKPLFEGGFDDNNNESDENNSEKPKKGKSNKDVTNSNKCNKVIGENDSSAKNDENLVADIAVPMKKSKLKALMAGNVLTLSEKPKLKVVTDDTTGSEKDSGKDLAGTMAAILNSAPSKMEEMESVFAGGFIDSDDEEPKKGKKVAKKEAKKAPKKDKRKSLPASLPSNESGDLSERPGSLSLGSDSVTLEGTGEIFIPAKIQGKSKSAKDKRKSKDSFVLLDDKSVSLVTNDSVSDSVKKAKGKHKKDKNQLETSLDLPLSGKDENNGTSSSGKKGKKGRYFNQTSDGDNNVPETLQNGEVEILIPNKKYKGKYKEAFKNEMNKSLQDSSDLNINTNNSEQVTEVVVKGETFAKFEKLKKTPPAFVKKAVAKATSPKSPKGNSPKKGSPTKVIL